MALLEADEVTKFYGDVCALAGVSLTVAGGEFVSIIGPNGAGKTTLVNVLTGLTRPSRGAVRFKDRNLAGIGPARLARLGMARSFQLVTIFPGLTVEETIAAAALSRLGRTGRLWARLAADADVRAQVREVAGLFGLDDRLTRAARTLPQGDKKLLDVASAFALRPDIIVLDEPTSGVSTRDKHAIMETLVGAARRIGIQAIIQVEHDMDIVFGYSDRIIALHEGRVLADGPPGTIRANPHVVATVLGRTEPRASRTARPRSEPGSPALATTNATSVEHRPPTVRAGLAGRPRLMLEVRSLTVDIQASRILRGVGLEVGERELVCLVGRNGAGKTTALRTIMGYLRPAAGSITFNGQSLVGLPTAAIAARGIGFAPEESEVFGDLTVAENIEIATWTRLTARPAAERVERAYSVFPRLHGYAARGGTQLSGGERKMLSVARALALDPQLLLLDEPFEGLSPAIIPLITASIVEIARLGVAILIAESNVHHVPEHTTRLYVVERGEIIFAGKPQDAQRDPTVLRIIGGGP